MPKPSLYVEGNESCSGLNMFPFNYGYSLDLTHHHVEASMYFKTTRRETANVLTVIGSLLQAPEMDMSTLIRSGSCRHVDEQRSTEVLLLSW